MIFCRSRIVFDPLFLFAWYFAGAVKAVAVETPVAAALPFNPPLPVQVLCKQLLRPIHVSMLLLLAAPPQLLLLLLLLQGLPRIMRCSPQ
jgi:hypothetical protein